MQRARTLHSQATEKRFFVCRLSTWNTLSRGGPFLGPQWRRGSQDPITPLQMDGQSASGFFPTPCGPVSSDLGVGYSQMAERNVHRGRRMKWVRTAEFRGRIPGDRRERAKDQRWGAWKLPSCPQTALVLLKQLPDKNAGCVSVRPGRHLAQDESARICGWLPWKPMKAVFAPLLHNTYFPEENRALCLLSFHRGRPSSHRKESNMDSLEVGSRRESGRQGGQR